MTPSRRLLTLICWTSALLLAACVLAPPPAQAFKYMSWNLLNYPNQAAARNANFRTIMAANHPDLMVVQEISSQDTSGVMQFWRSVLNKEFPGEYAVGPWYNGDDTDNGLFYRTAAFTFVSSDTIGTDLRAIAEYVLRPVGYTSSAANLRVYSMHLKASSGSDNVAQRLVECTHLRSHTNALGSGLNLVYSGDYNMYTSTESGYQKLLSSGNGQCTDPISRPGSWNDNASFADIHTQSTMTTSVYGGSTGGMDDRFDISLMSPALQDGEGLSYVTGTYDAYGQDGLHFNAAINAAPTIPEGATIANALANTSDHLPLILQIQLPPKVNAVASLPFGTVILGATATQSLAVSNSASTPADELNYTLTAPSGFSAPGGSFTANAGAGANSHTITMLTASAGVKSGNLTIASDDVDYPSKLVALSGTVLNHAVPSAAASPVALLDTLDFGTHDVGEFVDQTATVHNSGYGSLQALLNVYGATITGTDAARFSIVGGFNPATVGGTPASFTVHFDDTGLSSDTTCTATLTFNNRDQQDLAGAINLSNVSWYLTASVETQSAVPEAGVTPLATRLIGNSPNPFNPLTTISFDLAQAGPVRLTVYDVQGRLVSRLVDESMEMGRYRVSWDGRDASGRYVGSGIYFYCLETRELTQTRSMVLSK